jgi:ankyrin repeat protein
MSRRPIPNAITPLIAAAMGGDHGVVATLARHSSAGVDIDRVARCATPRGSREHTALSAAIACGHRGIALQLLDWGANPDLPNGRPPLHDAIAGLDAALVSALLDRGANPDAIDVESGDPPLAVAVGLGALEITRCLINRGAWVDKPGAGNRTPIFRAVASGHDECVRLLAEYGADVDMGFTDDLVTPLLLAVKLSQAACVRALIACGASVGVPLYDPPILACVDLAMVGPGSDGMRVGDEIAAALLDAGCTVTDSPLFTRDRRMILSRFLQSNNESRLGEIRRLDDKRSVLARQRQMMRLQFVHDCVSR